MCVREREREDTSGNFERVLHCLRKMGIAYFIHPENLTRRLPRRYRCAHDCLEPMPDDPWNTALLCRSSEACYIPTAHSGLAYMRAQACCALQVQRGVLHSNHTFRVRTNLCMRRPRADMRKNKLKDYMCKCSVNQQHLKPART